MQTLAGFLFYLRRPHYWPELLRRARRRLGLNLLPRPMGRNRGPAERWAGPRAISVDEAVRLLTGRTPSSIQENFPDTWSLALQGAKSCPVKMGGGGLSDLLYHLCVHLQARRAVETGVAYGFSSLAILLGLRSSEGALISVDMPYPGRGNDRYVGCAVPQMLRGAWTLIRYPDSIGLPRALRSLDGPLDLFHHDSDKQYEGRAWAFPLAWKHLRSGGLLVADDIDDNTAFRDFSEHLNLEPTVVRGAGAAGAGVRYVGILRKP